MRKIFTALLTVSLFVMPAIANAESGDVDAKIKAVDPNTMTITLDNGETYNAPAEFNYEGLEPGVGVTIYYTITGDKRMIDDLIVE